MTVDAHDLGIIADDLTGACDVAACFAPKIGTVRVLISAGAGREDVERPDVVNTQSRLLGLDSARELLFRVGSKLGTKKVVFKKIDAGLRGPLGAEISGLLEGLGHAGKRWQCVVAPAIPSIGRTTRGGIQFDHGVPIHQGELSRDPHSPPRSANIQEIVTQTGGGEIRIGDAETQDDLDRIVEEHSGRDGMLFVGSLGLARALARQLKGKYKPEIAPRPARKPMLVCGSRHRQSARQIDLLRQAGSPVLEFDPVHRRIGRAGNSSHDLPMVVRIAARERTQSSSGILLESFVEALAALQDEFRPDGLGVMGGETAYHLLKRLGAKSLDVFGSEAEVIARSRIVGGIMDGCRFVSKGGSVGADDAARNMLSLLTT